MLITGNFGSSWRAFRERIGKFSASLSLSSTLRENVNFFDWNDRELLQAELLKAKKSSIHSGTKKILRHNMKIFLVHKSSLYFASPE